ncbi:MAG TPA: universal stress protein [Polyangiaceae bacterium]|nr:universal stress protein [Polyangiaceae bacterium]
MTNTARKRLLVPVDYSAGSRRALEFALGLAESLEADVHVLHVWELMPHPPSGMRVQTPDGRSQLLTELIQKNAEDDMNGFLAKVAFPASVRHTHAIESGEPTRRIVEAARAGDYTMIVIGTEGKGALAQFVVGSVAEKVLRHSAIPVLMVPRAKD